MISKNNGARKLSAYLQRLEDESIYIMRELWKVMLTGEECLAQTYSEIFKKSTKHYATYLDF